MRNIRRVTVAPRLVATLSLSVAIGCGHIQPPSSEPTPPLGPPGVLVVLVVDSTGMRREKANAFLLEDPRVTEDVVSTGRAGVWTDVRGIGNLGAWRPGQYNLRVRLTGFRPEQKHVRVVGGRSDTLRVVMREPMYLR
jgi:hypothetical protein